MEVLSVAYVFLFFPSALPFFAVLSTSETQDMHEYLVALTHTHTCKGITGVVNAAFVGQVEQGRGRLATPGNHMWIQPPAHTTTTYTPNQPKHTHTHTLLKEKEILPSSFWQRVH